MKMQTVYTFFFFSLACALMLLFTGYSGGPAATLGVGYTGAPGDDMTFTCATCHNANAFGEVMVELTSDGSEVTYSAATSTPVKLTVTAASGMPSGYGIQLIALNEDDTPLDVTYSNLSTNLKESITGNGRKYLEHNGISDTNVFTFDFDINSAVGDTIIFHAAATAVDRALGNGGDSGSAGFTFIAAEVPLAVELTNFTATRTRAGIELNWRTETEQDNDYFVVEHATNGTDFSPLKTLGGAGTSQERNSYTYMHNRPTEGTNYYRLSIVDFDGKVTYSNVVVEKYYTSGMTINVYPQPAVAHSTVYIASATKQSAVLDVYDITGRLVETKNIQVEIGENLIDLDCSLWIPGNYLITLNGKQLNEEVLKFVKQ